MRGIKYFLSPAWESAINGWLETLIASGQSAATIYTRRGMVRTVATKLGTPTPQVSENQLMALVASQQWSNDYRRGIRTSLRSFYSYCVERGIVDASPAEVLPVVSESKPKPRPAPDSVMTHVHETARPRELLMARLGAEAGLRRSEIAKVRHTDLVEGIDGWELTVNGKGSRQRIVPVTVSLAEAILTYREPAGRNAGGWLFSGQIDGHISPGHVGTLLSKVMGEGWSAHKLRHRYASRGYAVTHDLLAVQQALGHASPAVTQRYVQVPAKFVRAVSDAAA